MSSLPQDAQARAAALDIHQSFCVQAPAGSGKTELLTQRLLKLLAHVEQPEEIVAFTFTRKAAAEMRKRLLESLQRAQERLNDPAFSINELKAHERQTHDLATAVLAHQAQQGWQLLDNGKRLRLNTIDSFTAYLSAQLPLSANMGARAVISTEVAPILKQAIHATLNQLEDNSSTGTALQVLLPHLQNNLATAEKLLLALLTKREQWLMPVLRLKHNPEHAKDLLEQALVELIDEQLQLTRTALAPFAKELLTLVRFATSYLPAPVASAMLELATYDALPNTDADSLPLWRTLVDFLLLDKHKAFRKALTAKQGFPSQKDARDKAEAAARKSAFGELTHALIEAGVLPLLQGVGKLPEPHYNPRQWEVLTALSTLLPTLAAQLNNAMQQAATVDHTETSLAALRALGEDDAPTDLALRLDYRIRHLLVDEFQDTSTLQYQLLYKLTRGWQDGDGRTLFIVGDGMQSCYAFRDAKVSLFLKIRNEGLGDIHPLPLDLQVNFRSDASVVQWVNRVFSRAFPAQDDVARGGVRYSASVARSETMLSTGVQCVLWTDADKVTTLPSLRRQLEAEYVVQLCQQWQQECPEQSMAILVRSRPHLQTIVALLRQHGLKWNANKLDSLLSYPAIGDLFILLRCILSLADVTAWFALLRTPFVGLALSDIQLLARHSEHQQQSLWSSWQQHQDLTTLSTDGQHRLQRCLAPLLNARRLRQQIPLRDLVEKLWLALGGPATLNDWQVLDNVDTFFALVEQQSQYGDITDIHAFEERLAAAYGSAVDPKVNLHVMTIHNAKGLEFDQVILPSLERKPRNNDKALLLWHEHSGTTTQTLPLLGLLPEQGQSDDSLYNYLRYEAEQRERLETTRLLYIAVTRAAKRCWLLGYVKASKEDYQCAASSLLQTVLPSLVADVEGLKVQLIPLPAENEANDSNVATLAKRSPLSPVLTQPLRRLTSQWVNPLGTPLLSSAGEAVTLDKDYESLLERALGDLVHLGLKQLVESGAHWLHESTCLPLWRSTLLPLCATEAELSTAYATLRTQLLACLHDPQIGWLFNSAMRPQDDHCEWALLSFWKDQRHDFVIDRTFIDEDGTRWIIDYKSSRLRAGQALADFCREQSTLYQPQLERYRQLFLHEKRSIRCALLFTALPLLHEVESQHIQ